MHDATLFSSILDSIGPRDLRKGRRRVLFEIGAVAHREDAPAGVGRTGARDCQRGKASRSGKEILTKGQPLWQFAPTAVGIGAGTSAAADQQEPPS